MSPCRTTSWVAVPEDGRDRRRVPHDLLDRPRGQLGPPGEQLPLVRVGGEGHEGIAELIPRGVVAGEDERDDHVAQLVVGQPVAGLLGSDEHRDEILARMPAPLADEPVGIVVEPDDGRLDPVPVGRDRRAEGQAEVGRPPAELQVVVEGDPEQPAHHLDRLRLGELVDELGHAGSRQPVGQGGGGGAHERAQPVDRGGDERPVEQAAEPGVVIAVLEQ